MELREYKSTDCEQMAQLFYNTVHSVNVKDYTEEQLNACVTGSVDLQEWNHSFLNHKTVQWRMMRLLDLETLINLAVWLGCMSI